jgi:hypothetical protein
MQYIFLLTFHGTEIGEPGREMRKVFGRITGWIVENKTRIILA